MVPIRTRRWFNFAIAVVAGSFACNAYSVELVVNGSFETNGGVGSATFNGWNTFDQPGSQGGFKVQTGVFPPITPFVVPAPPNGNFAAMTDQSGAGSHVLYQDVAVPAGTITATLTAQIFVLNQAEQFSPAPTLDYTSVPNQQVRFDIATTTSAPQDIGGGVLKNVFSTLAKDPVMTGYTIVTADMSAYAGQTVRLRFTETDNRQGLNFGVDHVSLVATVCTLDIDGDNSINALTDGLLIIRAMFGLTGIGVTNGAIGAMATRTTWADIQPYINSGLDVDGNGTVDALTDGIMILRAMFGLTGVGVTNSAVGPGATRSSWASIRTYLNNCGGNFSP